MSLKDWDHIYVARDSIRFGSGSKGTTQLFGFPVQFVGMAAFIPKQHIRKTLAMLSEAESRGLIRQIAADSETITFEVDKCASSDLVIENELARILPQSSQ